MESSGSAVIPGQAEIRNAMAHLPAAVNILTTDGPGGQCGITVSAVCSVTDTPPTILVCVNQNSAMHDVFRANGRVCLNVLGGEQQELAMHVAFVPPTPPRRADPASSPTSWT
jgi:flavin reductase (NADH)